jgi:hypothetical protein
MSEQESPSAGLSRGILDETPTPFARRQWTTPAVIKMTLKDAQTGSFSTNLSDGQPEKS